MNFPPGDFKLLRRKRKPEFKEKTQHEFHQNNDKNKKSEFDFISFDKRNYLSLNPQKSSYDSTLWRTCTKSPRFCTPTGRCTMYT